MPACASSIFPSAFTEHFARPRVTSYEACCSRRLLDGLASSREMGPASTVSISPRLVVMGLDGGTWDAIDPLLASGDLPHISGVLEGGRRGVLASIFPPLTGPAWQTIFTGLSPGEHGVFDMTVFDRSIGRRRPLCMADWAGTPLWRRVADLGLRGGYLGIPFTYPPPEVDGWFVSGITGTPTYGDRMVSPAGLFEEISRAAGQYPLDIPEKRGSTYQVDVLLRQMAWMHDATLYLLRHHPVDVLVVVATYTDYVQHFFARSRQHDGIDMVRLAYQAADRLLGDIRVEVGPNVPIVLLSDHGAAPVAGFINSTRVAAAVSPLGEARARASVRGFSSLKRLWRSTGKAALKAIGADPRRISEWGVRALRRTGAEPDATVVGQYGLIWVTGDPALARPEDVERGLRALADMRDPSDARPLFEVAPGSEVYPGGGFGQAPHVIARVVRPFYEFRTASELAPLVIAPEEAEAAGIEYWTIEGTHSPDGVWAVSEAGAHASVPNALPDVLGSLMELLGAEPPADQSTSGPPDDAERCSAYTPEEEKMILGRLYDLGYLD